MYSRQSPRHPNRRTKSRYTARTLDTQLLPEPSLRSALCVTGSLPRSRVGLRYRQEHVPGFEGFSVADAEGGRYAA